MNFKDTEQTNKRRPCSTVTIHEWLVLLTFIVLLLLCMATPCAAASERKPNILFIAIDDLNDWVGFLDTNPQTLTPNMDRLAARGTVFTNAHATVPLCGPTRAALLSGLRPSTTGMYGQVDYQDIKQNPRSGRIPLLPAYLAKQGYRTLSTGKIFHEGSPRQAFDKVGDERRDFGPKPPRRMAYTPPQGTRTSTDWGPYPARNEQMPDYKYAQWTIEQLQQEKGDKPFFLSVGFVRPHVPWHVPQEWFDKHPLDKTKRPPYLEDDMDDLPETARLFSVRPSMPKIEWMKQNNRWEESVQAYLASITFVDHCVGMVLDALAESPHADNTIVILVGDHGYQLGEKGLWAKHTLWERATRVPLVISMPGQDKSLRTHRPVNQIDLYPTIAELAHLRIPPHTEGTSLVPLLTDPRALGYEASLSTFGYGNHSVRTERWRYIRYADGAEELYDHDTDPNEWRNLAQKPQYAPVIAELKKYLPSSDAPSDPNSARGVTANEYLKTLFERTRRNQ